jgi:hypothetical protein
MIRGNTDGGPTVKFAEKVRKEAMRLRYSGIITIAMKRRYKLHSFNAIGAVSKKN